jgi:uncharacterized protein YgfB (UPF0149 family)
MDARELIRHLRNVAEIAEDCTDDHKEMMATLATVSEYVRELISKLEGYR